jgi:hypothetical protein
MQNSYTANVISIESNGDAILELPQKLCNKMGWGEGTILDISTEVGTGAIIIKEVKNV